MSVEALHATLYGHLTCSRLDDDLDMTVSIWRMTVTIWEMTVSIWEMTVSIWDISSLCPTHGMLTSRREPGATDLSVSKAR